MLLITVGFAISTVGAAVRMSSFVAQCVSYQSANACHQYLATLAGDRD